MTPYDQLCLDLPKSPKTWLVTGVAGFIGSNLLETLLRLDQRVIGLDNFATGHQRNLDEVQQLVSPAQWTRFRLFHALRNAMQANGISYAKQPVYRDFRAGDVRHSQADIGKAQTLLGYEPPFDIAAGVTTAVP